MSFDLHVFPECTEFAAGWLDLGIREIQGEVFDRPVIGSDESSGIG